MKAALLRARADWPRAVGTLLAAAAGAIALFNPSSSVDAVFHGPFSISFGLTLAVGSLVVFLGIVTGSPAAQQPGIWLAIGPISVLGLTLTILSTWGGRAYGLLLIVLALLLYHNLRTARSLVRARRLTAGGD